MAAPTVGAAAVAAGGQIVGSLLGGFFGGGGPAQIDPAIQAELTARGIDIAKFQANLEAAIMGMKLPFEQELALYPQVVQQNLGQAYERAYGSVERAAISMAERAFRGEPSQATQRLLNDYSAQAGTQMKAQEQSNLLRAAQGGMDKTSPAVQAQLADQERMMREGTMMDQNRMLAEASQQDMSHAQNLLANARESQRIVGMYGWNPETGTFDNMPELPQTAEQKAMAPLKAELAALQARRARIAAVIGGPLVGMKARALQNIDQQIADLQGRINQGTDFGNVEHAEGQNVRWWEEDLGGDVYSQQTQGGASSQGTTNAFRRAGDFGDQTLGQYMDKTFSYKPQAVASGRTVTSQRGGLSVREQQMHQPGQVRHMKIKDLPEWYWSNPQNMIRGYDPKRGY